MWEKQWRNTKKNEDQGLLLSPFLKLRSDSIFRALLLWRKVLNRGPPGSPENPIWALASGSPNPLTDCDRLFCLSAPVYIKFHNVHAFFAVQDSRDLLTSTYCLFFGNHFVYTSASCMEIPNWLLCQSATYRCNVLVIIWKIVFWILESIYISEYGELLFWRVVWKF